MRHAVMAASIATVLAGCGSIPEGRFECSGDSECPNGWSCLAGRCYSMPDAMDAGRDAAVEDSGPPITDGMVEPSGPFFFGRPSPLVDILLGSSDSHGNPWLSSDGMRLYFIGPPGRTPYFATRSGLDEHFGAPARVDVLGWDTLMCVSVTYAPSEVELVAACDSGTGDYDLYYSSRSSRGVPFEMPMRIAEASFPGTDETQPFLTSDGTELFFASLDSQTIYRSPRQLRAFSFPEAVTFDDGDEGLSPFVTDDGMHLVFSRMVSPRDQRLMIASRATPGSTAFALTEEIPEPITHIGQLTTSPFVSEETAEIFFASDRPWTPGTSSIWRAHVCQGVPCDDPVLPCGGASSPDQRHCYTAIVTSQMPWDMAHTTCRGLAGPGEAGHLLTVHSVEEANVWRSQVADGDLVWSGGNDIVTECNTSIPNCGFVWASQIGAMNWNEPFFGDLGMVSLDIGEPDNGALDDILNSDCLMLQDRAASPVGASDTPCEAGHYFVCEVELWPWW